MAKAALNQRILESNILLLLIALFVMGTAIYIFPAGRIQPGHYLAPIIMLVGASFIRWRDLQLSDKWLIAFGVYAFIINAFYYLTVKNPDFLSSILYWAFNIALFIFLHHIIKCSNKIKSILAYVFFLCILIMLFLWSVGYLRTEITNYRFLAQFNDPNQMGHWLLCAFISICLLSNKGLLSNRYFQLCLLLIIALLISATGSRSATIAFIPLAIGYFWLKFIREGIGFSNPTFLITILFFITAVFFIFTAPINKHLLAPEHQSALVHNAPSNRVNNTNWTAEAKLRGYYRPHEYPQYLIFGAGQGGDVRFNAIHEIHSSIIGIFFYYGIIGFTIFMGFIYQAFRRLNLPEVVMLSTPFVYGFFTYGLRTPIFWVLMAIVVASRTLPDEN